MLDLRELIEGTIAELPYNAEIDIAGFSEDITEGIAKVDALITNHAGFIELTAKFKVSLKAVCARCGKETETTFEFEIVSPLAEKLENADEDQDTYYMIENGALDIDDVCESSIILNIPTRFLCKEDCKGLCPTCGADLNDGACSCDGKVIDPRLEKLKEFFK